MRYIIREPYAIAAIVVIVLTAALVLFSATSSIPYTKPVVGIVLFSLLPVLAIAGVVNFYLAMRSDAFHSDD